MTFQEYEDLKRFKQIHLAIRTVISALSVEPDPETGISSRDAFIASYDRLSASQVESILSELPIGAVDDKALSRAGSPRARIASNLLDFAPKAVDADSLAIALAKVTASDPGTQDRLAAVIRILLLGQVALTAILRAIDLWMAAANTTMVDALSKVGVTDARIIKEVGSYNL